MKKIPLLLIALGFSSLLFAQPSLMGPEPLYKEKIIYRLQTTDSMSIELMSKKDLSLLPSVDSLIAQYQRDFGRTYKTAHDVTTRRIEYVEANHKFYVFMTPFSYFSKTAEVGEITFDGNKMLAGDKSVITMKVGNDTISINGRLPNNHPYRVRLSISEYRAGERYAGLLDIIMGRRKTFARWEGIKQQEY